MSLALAVSVEDIGVVARVNGLVHLIPDTGSVLAHTLVGMSSQVFFLVLLLSITSCNEW